MTIGQPFRPNETNKWGNIREGNYTEIDDDGNIIQHGDADVTITSLTPSMPVWSDANKKLVSKAVVIPVPIVISMYDAQPARNSETNWNGGFVPLVTTQPLSSGVPINVTKGTGKIVVYVISGADVDGTITITGDTIDRETGVKTVGDTDTIVVDALTTNNSITDSNGNLVHMFIGAYITSKWFTGAVVLSTTDLNITSMNVYHISFDQFNDNSDMTIDTFDVSLITTNVNAEFDAYLYVIHVTTGDKCDIHLEGELHLGADGETAIANRYWRLRKGNIDDTVDGSTDGFWVDIHYSNNPAYIEDVTAKVWATKQVTAI